MKRKSMIQMMHRLVNGCGKYKAPIRASYVTGFFKGMFMKAPLMLCFFMISYFMAGAMTKKLCLIFGAALLLCVILQAILQHISNILQSATGYKVFADKRMELGDHFRKLSMGYFSAENCMTVLETLASFIISQIMMCSFMFYLDWRLGITSIIVVGAFILIGKLMTGKTLKHSVQKQECSEKLTSAVLEFAEGIGIIKTFNLTGKKSKELTKRFEESCEDSIKFENDYAPWSLALLLTYGIGSALILFVAGALMKWKIISGVYMIGAILFLFDVFT